MSEASQTKYEWAVLEVEVTSGLYVSLRAFFYCAANYASIRELRRLSIYDRLMLDAGLLRTFFSHAKVRLSKSCGDKQTDMRKTDVGPAIIPVLDCRIHVE